MTRKSKLATMLGELDSPEARALLAGKSPYPRRTGPRPRKPRWCGRQRGVTSGETIVQFWQRVFWANERRGTLKHKRWTDRDLRRMVRKEFPDRDPCFETKDVRGVQRARRLYNRGVWSGGVPPIILSEQYDAEGNVVVVRRGPRKATKQSSILRHPAAARARLAIANQTRCATGYVAVAGNHAG